MQNTSFGKETKDSIFFHLAWVSFFDFKYVVKEKA